MEITLHDGSPIPSLLADSSSPAEPTSQDDHRQLCVVGGALSQERLQNRLAREGHPPSSVASFTTVDDISERVLKIAGDATPVLLPETFTQRLITEVFDRARAGSFAEPVRDLADSLPADDDDVAETVYEELNEYYRCTDAGKDHQELIAIASELDNTYACTSSQKRLEQFDALTAVLEEQASELAEGASEEQNIIPFISRSHFVSEARSCIESAWTEAYGGVSWVGVSTISVFDNPTLRLLLEIARTQSEIEFHFFLGAGSYERQRKRLERLSDIEINETSEPNLTGAGQSLFDAMEGDTTEIPEAIEFVEAPERRREIEYLAQDIREKLQQGVEPSDIIVTARNIDLYATHIKDIFESNGIPYHLETKQPVLHAPSYRFLTSTFDLIQAAVDNESIGYDTLVDPLRMGFCLPVGDRRHWPLRDQVFLHLEQRLSDAEDRNGERTVGEWQHTVDNLSGWDEPRERMNNFLDWIVDQTNTPPQNGEELRSLVRQLVSDFIYQLVPERRSRPDGPGIDSTRSRLTEPHATSIAKQVYNSAIQVGTHYDYLHSVFSNDGWEPSWEEARAALFDVLGGKSIRRQHKDGNAVRVVDAGDTFFMDSEHVHLLGLSRGDFPTERQEAPLLHENLREAVVVESERGEVLEAEEDTTPYFRLAAQETQFSVDVDYYELALRVSTDTITVSHQYRDTEGNAVPWSSFVDLLDLDDSSSSVTRIRADQWLPEPGTTGMDSWEAVGSRVADRDRQRLIQFHANRELPHSTDPNITSQDVEALSAFTDRTEYLEQVKPRYERYARPPWEITVSADETAFDETSLEDIIGSPVSVHELDLFSQCQLKFYYYQFLFNHEGTEVDRQSIPYYAGSGQNYRFGELPEIIQHHYAGDRSREVWKEIIEQQIRDRATLSTQFDSRDAVREWVREEFNDYVDRQIGPQLADEYTLVRQEEEGDEPIRRQWGWRDDHTISIDGTEAEVWVPSHRRDVLPEDDSYELSLFHVRHSSYARKATKSCWNGSNRSESCESICQSCSRSDNCDFPTKFMLDHRIHTVTHDVENHAGFVFQDQYESGSDARWGLLKQHHARHVRGGIDNGPEANLDQSWAQTPRRAWYGREDSWNDDLKEHLEAFLPNDGEVTYNADRDFVDRGGCDSCVYRSMCAVPDGGDF